MTDIKCPECGGEASKIIYAGIPAKLCLSEDCIWLWGTLSILITFFPFNGVFFLYEGNYFIALVAWWREMGEEE